MAPIMEERRGALRYKVHKRARIGCSNGSPCIVRELSATGARLAVAGAISLPGRFDLVMLDEGMIRPVRIVWRGDHEIGVVFDGEARFRPTIVSPPWGSARG
jgi:hypothetical protein